MTLNELRQKLDALNEPVQVNILHDWLVDLETDTDELAEHIQFSDDHYVRNYICGSEQYHMLALCWRSGQRSPIHNHKGSICGFRVLAGKATETVFRLTPSLQVKPAWSNDMPVGYMAVAPDMDIHQVSNLEEAGCNLVTLHVYSPPLLKMETWSMTDIVGEFPRSLTFEYGGGI